MGGYPRLPGQKERQIQDTASTATMGGGRDETFTVTSTNSVELTTR